MTRYARAIFQICILGAAAFSQTFRGGIAGMASDSSGAVLPDAVVKLTNDATGLTYSTITSSAGSFVFQDIPLGSYTIMVSKPGFQIVKVDQIHVTAGEIRSVPVKLPVAHQTVTVEVSASEAALDTASTTLTTDVGANTVQNLPLNGRCAGDCRNSFAAGCGRRVFNADARGAGIRARRPDC